jgi:hypothetical protein
MIREWSSLQRSVLSNDLRQGVRVRSRGEATTAGLRSGTAHLTHGKVRRPRPGPNERVALEGDRSFLRIWGGIAIGLALAVLAWTLIGSFIYLLVSH